MQRRLRLAAPMLVGIWLIVAGFYGAAPAEPIAPLDPTIEDCTALSHEFYLLYQQLSAEMDRCMKSPPIIGQAYQCLYSKTVRTTVAWVQCADIDVRRCELQARRDAEYNLCMSRVKRQQDTGARKAIDTVAKVDELYGKYQDTVDFVRDPKAYLKQAFQGSLTDLYRKLFPSLYGGGEDDVRGISALYNYAAPICRERDRRYTRCDRTRHTEGGVRNGCGTAPAHVNHSRPVTARHRKIWCRAESCYTKSKPGSSCSAVTSPPLTTVWRRRGLCRSP